MRTQIAWLIASAIVLAVLAIAIRNAAAEQFYEGKTIRIVVERPAGGVRLAC